MLLYINYQARYLWCLLSRLRARAEPTKSSEAGHIVPDKLQARQPTHLYDVIWHRSVVAKRLVCARSDLNLMMGLVVAKTKYQQCGSTREHRNDRTHYGLLSYYIQCGVCGTSTVDRQRHYFFFRLAFNIPIETSNFGASVTKLIYYCSGLQTIQKAMQ